MSTPLFEATDLVVKYHEVLALDRLSMAVQQGERVALLRANGSGKSTLLRVLAALIFPDSGTLTFEGESITEARFAEREPTFQFRKRVGLVFQNPDIQSFNPTVFDEISFGPLQLRWPKRRILQRVEEMLERMDIAQLRDCFPHQLSGGEKKRVALASILILDPEVLLLDEPTAALDPYSQSHIVDLLLSWGGGRRTVITATHDLDSLEGISDRCFVFEAGRIVVEGSPLQILHDVPLLQRTRLISTHRHSHPSGMTTPHPHLHREPS